MGGLKIETAMQKVNSNIRSTEAHPYAQSAESCIAITNLLPLVILYGCHVMYLSVGKRVWVREQIN